MLSIINPLILGNNLETWVFLAKVPSIASIKRAMPSQINANPKFLSKTFNAANRLHRMPSEVSTCTLDARKTDRLFTGSSPKYMPDPLNGSSQPTRQYF